MIIISFLFATLFLFMFNLFYQMISCSKENRDEGSISTVSMISAVVTLFIITWNIFAIIFYFN